MRRVFCGGRTAAALPPGSGPSRRPAALAAKGLERTWGGGEVSPPWAAQSAHGSGVWPLQTQPLTLLSPEDTGRHEALLCQQTDG